MAASFMLGGVVIGNPTFFIDKLFNFIEKSTSKEKQYYLNAIRMIIITNPECLKGNIGELGELFLTHADHAEKDIRATVAESMGKFFPLAPTDLVTFYDNALEDKSVLIRTTFAQSVRYIGSKTAFPDPPMLLIVAEGLISQSKHDNPDLKKACLEGLATIVVGNLSSISEKLGDIEQFALQEAKVRPELIIEVDLGPFK